MCCIRAWAVAGLSFFLMALLSAMGAEGAQSTGLTFCCAPDNDLYVALQKSGTHFLRYSTAEEAIEKASTETAVLLLADGYPTQRTAASPALLARAFAKRLKVYLEFPDSLADVSMAPVRQSVWERVVVASDAFGTALPHGRILMLPGCEFLPVAPRPSLLALARVAGFDTAVYGLPDNAFPLLFEIPERRLLVATTKLSAFRQGRYAPARDWQVVWQQILRQLAPSPKPIALTWQSSVTPAYGPKARLPRDVEQRAFRNGVQWYRNARLFVSSARQPELEAQLRAQKASAPTPASSAPLGDGSLGILEGYASTIQGNGDQDQLIALRADCNAEAAMVFGMDWTVAKSGPSRDTARKLLNYMFTTMQSGVRGDPRHPAYGLIAWGAVAPAWEVANYGDDNARAMLAAMAAAACLDTDEWDANLLRALLANLRTTGRLGFRGDRIDIPALEQRGWKAYHEAAPVNYSPHFESYLWACYLWAYRHTHLPEFLERAKTGIRMTMEHYPQGWRLKDNTERARMVLCLAWLVRVEDTAEHRQWLSQVANDLLTTQQPSGALRERFGQGGHFQAPASNEAYGTGEAPLGQREGDPVCDQLYTTGFALLGLHEAVAATGDRDLKAAEDKLAGFLCRIQVHAPQLPSLDGAWFRAFDDQIWDYWGSAADIGWGPWNAESGWGPAWINAVLALRSQNISFWELTAHSRIARQLPEVQAQMSRNDGSPWKSSR
ncbi:MAG: hypothetical protein JWL77_5719 [Chthonomonadaceae bacterium]|nr:hypothetical protein [Chthonomonadaceae bacterium]